MDDLDRRIVEELQVNALQSSRASSKKLGVSSGTIRSRVNQLVKSNVLSIVALINPLAIGYSVWVNVGIRVKPGTAHEIADRLMQYPECYSSMVTLGRFDVMAAMFFKSNEELTEFITIELPKIEGVEYTETMLYTMPHKYYKFNRRIEVFDNLFNIACFESN